MKVSLARSLFIKQIEEGEETFIPKGLSQDDLPWSFRYYDPIQAIIQEMVSDDRRAYFTLRQQVAGDVHAENNL
jgi:hypothetical protein